MMLPCRPGKCQFALHRESMSGRERSSDHNSLNPSGQRATRATIAPPEQPEAYLRTWAPHSRALGSIEHAELYACSVAQPCAHAVKSVDVTNEVTFAHTAKGRVARHHLHRQHVQCACQSLRSRDECLANVAGYWVDAARHLLG